MKRYVTILLVNLLLATALNLDYLDPTKLQTRTSAQEQQEAASRIIQRYMSSAVVEVNPILFKNNKDVFVLRTVNGILQIRASTGVAAVWGFNYFLKKYAKSQIAWQVQRVVIPNSLPDIDEVVTANDRFRYYQNVCTQSYSFVWWTVDQWLQHVEWMALNGINLALAPIAQEAAWSQIYRRLGMTDDEIDEYFTGPAFLAWQRMGNLRGWGGPLPKSWHAKQKTIQDAVVDYMFKLGIIPIYPAFNGHVPKAFSRLYPNATFYNVSQWSRFTGDYCCGLYLDPKDPLFIEIGRKFIREISEGSSPNHIYSADPFNEISVYPWTTDFVTSTASAIFTAMTQEDESAVWLIQNWMLVNAPGLWPKNRVKTFFTSIPNGRLLVLDLQSEQYPQYNLYDMYSGQPFIWCMLHNFGGTLGMFGNMQTINNDVYEVRSRVNSTMIGVGLTPEGINQNYVVYDLMLESAWRKNPVRDMNTWVADYAERRYGCNATSGAWRYLLKSVYSYNSLFRMHGQYVITRRPSYKIRPWAWYSSHDLFEALRRLVFVSDDNCNTPGFYHDLVDVTRQALQYRAEQLYVSLLIDRNSNSWVFNSTISRYLDVMQDMEKILASNNDFTATAWLDGAANLASNPQERYLYELNAKNQITLWGPNGEITDYACKQWAELFHYYYIPRWRMFLNADLDAKLRNERFDATSTQNVVRAMVEEPFASKMITPLPAGDPKMLAVALYEKWAYVPGLSDLPRTPMKGHNNNKATISDEDNENPEDFVPSVTMWFSTSQLP